MQQPLWPWWAHCCLAICISGNSTFLFAASFSSFYLLVSSCKMCWLHCSSNCMALYRTTCQRIPIKLSSNKKTYFYSSKCVPVHQKSSNVSTTGVSLAASGSWVAEPLQKGSCSRCALQLLRAGPAELQIVFFMAALGCERTGHHQVSSAELCPLLPSHLGALMKEQGAVRK